FAAANNQFGTELWRSDGTEAGTYLVRDINAKTPTGSSHGSPRYLTNVNGQLFFVANDGNYGFEPWLSDGTTSGTRLAEDITPGFLSSFTHYQGAPTPSAALIDDWLYFVANTRSGP